MGEARSNSSGFATFLQKA